MTRRPTLIQAHPSDPTIGDLLNIPRVDYSTLFNQLTFPLRWCYDHYIQGWMPVEITNESTDESWLRRQGLMNPAGRRWWEDLQKDFAANGYVVIPQLVAGEYAQFLSEVFHRQPHDRWPEMPTIKRTSVNNLPIIRLLHQQLERMIGYIVQPQQIRSSYSFTSHYETGSALPKHTDRPQCMFNLSLMLDAVPDPSLLPQWPLYLEVNGFAHKIQLKAGDGVLYRGTVDPHWRDTMPESLTDVTGTFLHFVDSNFEGSLD